MGFRELSGLESAAELRVHLSSTSLRGLNGSQMRQRFALCRKVKNVLRIRSGVAKIFQQGMSRLSSLYVLTFAGAAFLSAMAEPAAVSSASNSSLVPIGTLRSGIHFAGETVDGDFSVLVPLHSNLGEGGRLGGSLIFAEPYAQWVEKGSVQAGIGLGMGQFSRQFQHSRRAVSTKKRATDQLAR